MKKKLISGITVIICTKNRPQKLFDCLFSLNTNTVLPDEVLIIDQSDQPNSTKDIVKKKFVNLKIRWLLDKQTGLSKARNKGLSLLNKATKVVAFTDDDCLVSNNWIEEINQTLKESDSTKAVFGDVLPYLKNKKEKYLCPFYKKTSKKQKKTGSLVLSEVGIGANMAFKKEVFIQVGIFKEQLGVGSIFFAGEDTEFFLRINCLGFEVKNLLKSKVWHNRWLSEKNFYHQKLKYLIGSGAACASIFLDKYQKKALLVLFEILINEIKESYFKIKAFGKLLNFKMIIKEIFLNLGVNVALVLGFLKGLVKQVNHN